LTFTSSSNPIRRPHVAAGPETIVESADLDAPIRFAREEKKAKIDKKVSSAADVKDKLPPVPPPRRSVIDGPVNDGFPVWQPSVNPCGCSFFSFGGSLNNKPLTLIAYTYIHTGSKSGCLKLYCSCYASQNHCSAACRCGTCLNNLANRKDWLKAFRASEGKRSNVDPEKKTVVRCSCTSTNCLKKYCDCFRANQRCHEACKCIACLNR